MYFLAIDEGTGSTRAILYDKEGRLCFKSQHALAQNYPQHGWVEQDAEEIWQKTCLAIRDVAAQVNVDQIVACGITNQRETTVLWDTQTGRCLAPAISWQDARTANLFASMSAEDSEWIQAKTGLKPSPYFSAGKLQWLLSHLNDAPKLLKEDRLAFGTIDSFILWRLTNGRSHLTDVTNASRTLLFNIHTLSWDEELLARFHIPQSVLPKIVPNDAQFGLLHSEILGTEIPITAMIGDQQAALVGQACIEPGMMKATYGSGGFLLLNTGKACIQSGYGLITTVAYHIKNKITYGLEGNLYHAGTTLKWLRDGLKILPEISQSEFTARSLPDNGGVYLLPASSGLGAPHWSTTNGAIISGLTQNSTSSHLVRAALEAIAFQTKDILVSMQHDYNSEISTLRVDGGMTKNTWLLQYLASICEIKIERSKEIETTALGAAMLAALNGGYLSSLSEIANNWCAHSTYMPDKNLCSYINDYQGWIHAIKNHIHVDVR